MIIEVDTYQKIRHLYEHEGKSQRDIARMLGISRNTVKKYCTGSQVPWERQGTSGRTRYVITEDIMTFIRNCLASDQEENIPKQKHTAKRIYDRLVEETGFSGGESTIRDVVALIKDTPKKVFLPLSFEPGEAIQMDWGEATVYVAGKKHKVQLLCLRECYSADIYCMTFYRQNEESFLEGQVFGFEYFGGVTQRIIFDNARVAVKEGFAVHAKLQDRYQAFAAHYAFHCDFCNIGAAHEKGLVEGLVGWVRRNILVPIPRVKTLEELNREIRRRCLKYREHTIQGKEHTVGERARTARLAMKALPPYRFDPAHTITALVGTYSTVRFEGNHYSVPITHAGKEVSVKGYGNEIVIFRRNAEIARYLRCYERGKTSYRLEHYLEVLEQRPRSVLNARPVKETVAAPILELGRRLSGPREMVELLRLCVDYGQDEVLRAAGRISSQHVTVEHLRISLAQSHPPVRVDSSQEVIVPKPQLDQYDILLTQAVTP